MGNNPMADAVDNVDVTNIYECIEEAKPLFDIELENQAKYNYDNVIAEQIDLRDVLVLNLFNTINSMNEKLVNGRIKDKDAEKIRIDYLKTYINACNCFNSLCKQGNVNTKYDKTVIQNFIDLDNVFIDTNVSENENHDQ